MLWLAGRVRKGGVGGWNVGVMVQSNVNIHINAHVQLHVTLACVYT